MEQPYRPALLDELLEMFAVLETDLVDVPVVQSAAPFLDAVGEDLRRKIFMTENDSGASLCLRPDFTIPICLHHLNSGLSAQKRYSYLGTVFRQQRHGPSEIMQGGIEDIGDANIPLADARAIADAYGIAKRLTRSTDLSAIVGDQAMFEAVIRALGLPSGWQRRLVRAFGNTAQIEILLAKLDVETPAAGFDPAVSAIIGTRDQERLSGYIATFMKEAGYTTSRSRSPNEIASRLLEKMEMDGTRLSHANLEALRLFLGLEMPLADAPAALHRFLRDNGLIVDVGLGDFETRVQALADTDIDMDRVSYKAGFGRHLDYYTGLVFEITRHKNAAVLVGGGRFDRLLSFLGSETDIPAVGFSLWPELLYRNETT
ncbi:ATP phosphoribosyltransferase regulatory subunit [Mesorhizobium sp. CO1-1-11]|nr:ATP phosphoribosyltransferase regulatory subunit [Mesorhizobium sp. CO1-1-11]